VRKSKWRAIETAKLASAIRKTIGIVGFGRIGRAVAKRA